MIELPATLKEICDEAFYGCSSLQKVVIPDNVTELGVNVFSFCYELINITLSTEYIKRVDTGVVVRIVGMVTKLDIDIVLSMYQQASLSLQELQR